MADAFDSVYAIDAATGKEIWSFNVGSKVNGSLAVSADNGEIYANTRIEIRKLYDRGDHAELAWVSNMDMYDTGRLQRNIKVLGAEITSNGIAFLGAAGIVAGKQKFPLKLGVGLIDRETGEVRYFADGSEDSVSSMVTGPDGGMYVGNSPLRRVLGRSTFGEHVSPQPVRGGVTRFKPVGYHLMLRDGLWAIATRAENTAAIAVQAPQAAQADLFQLRQLLTQCEGILPLGREEGSKGEAYWSVMEAAVLQVRQRLTALPENPGEWQVPLRELSQKLQSTLDHTAMTEL